MSKKSLKRFVKWRDKVRIRLEKLGYNVGFFESPVSGNNSSGIKFKNNTMEASIIAWEHGDIFPEAYYIPDSNFILIDKVDEQQFNMETVLDAYLNQIIDYHNLD